MSGKGRFVSAMHWLIVVMIATGGGSLIASCTTKAPAAAKEVDTAYVVHSCFMRVLGPRDADGDIPVSLLCEKPVPLVEPEAK